MVVIDSITLIDMTWLLALTQIPSLQQPICLLLPILIHSLCPPTLPLSSPQDSPAYIGLAEDHISVMVAVDAATEQNGCLQVRGVWHVCDVLCCISMLLSVIHFV